MEKNISNVARSFKSRTSTSCPLELSQNFRDTQNQNYLETAFTLSCLEIREIRDFEDRQRGEAFDAVVVVIVRRRRPYLHARIGRSRFP